MVHNQATETSPLVVKPGHSDHSSSSIQGAEKRPDERARRRWRLSPWSRLLVVLALVGGVTLTKRFLGQMRTQQALDTYTKLNVAFVGNSMFYFNDFPRFFSVFSGDRVLSQNSCLHGGGSIPSLLMEGNAMYPQFETEQAILTKRRGHNIYDYGACTPEQLMLGTDPRLDDPGYAQPEDVSTGNLNPCHEDPYYFRWAKAHFKASTPDWDVVLINDNTRNPARASSRARSLAFLEQFWVPLLQKSGATPVFLWTHAYSVESTPTRNMTGLEDVANFTSLTYAGIKAYVDILKPHLPESQEPRIAPVGLAFLTVYEENPDLWRQLFHAADHIHASPSGSFLQACIVHYTLFGEMPDREHVVHRPMASLWRTARMMQHAWEPANPFPTREQAAYLYRVAKRVMVHGHVPASFIDYQNGETAYGQP